MTDPLLHLVIALGLSALFAGSALHKLRQPRRFAAQVDEYRLLPPRLTGVAVWVFVTTECALALSLPWPSIREATGTIAALLLTLYGVAIGANLLRARTYIDCGCGDSAILLTPWLLVRNGVLAAGAALLTVAPTARELGIWDAVTGLLALPALVILYQAMDQLLDNASALREWNTAND
ncbi:MAG: MauE/DoxX family redox-associated membrane protein [Pseudomonadales bacterium]